MENEVMVYHDSHHSFFRDPFGAVPCGTAVRLRLAVSKAFGATGVNARFWQDGESRIRMERTDISAPVPGGYDFYECSAPVPGIPCHLWYYFELEGRTGTHYYSNNREQRGGVGNLGLQPLGSYQITVHAGNYKTPDWFKGSIMYQIFVDRFRKGSEPDLRNYAKCSYIHNDWNDDPLVIPHRGSTGIHCSDFFGGNLKGVISELDYLKDLGVGVIYLNPIFEAPSNHKYDTADYNRVDPAFGDEGIFAELCREAGTRGIRVVLDGVFSHTGADSVYFNRLGRYPGSGAYQSKKSPYYKWYKFQKHPDEYECWWNIDTLPNIDEMEPSYRDFIMGKDKGVARRWLKLGASGWRLDVADELPDAFLRELRGAVKDEKSDAVIIGEVWEDASNKLSYGNLRHFLLGEELDSVTNYPFRDHVLAFLVGREDSRTVNLAFMNMKENYPKETLHSTMNMIGSHDVTRALTVLEEAPSEDRLSREAQGRWHPSPGMREIGIKRMKLAALWQMTFPGVPCIFYGDEAGMEGHRDPFCRRTFPWGREDKDLQEWYMKLAKLRNAIHFLKYGDFSSFSGEPHIFGFFRDSRNGMEELGAGLYRGQGIMALNRSPELGGSMSLAKESLRYPKYFDLLTGEYLEAGAGGLDIPLSPLQGRLLVSEGISHLAL